MCSDGDRLGHDDGEWPDTFTKYESAMRMRPNDETAGSRTSYAGLQSTMATTAALPLPNIQACGQKRGPVCESAAHNHGETAAETRALERRQRHRTAARSVHVKNVATRGRPSVHVRWEPTAAAGKQQMGLSWQKTKPNNDKRQASVSATGPSWLIMPVEGLSHHVSLYVEAPRVLV